MTCVFHKYRIRLNAAALGIKASPRLVRDAMLQALAAEGVNAVLWQPQPVPGQKLFRDKVGYGAGYPWDRAAPVDYRLEQFPETTRLLEGPYASSRTPIHQSLELREAYAFAIEKVWLRLDEVLAM